MEAHEYTIENVDVCQEIQSTIFLKIVAIKSLGKN